MPTETDKWKELRKPFPAGTVGKLPKPYKKDSPKGKCSDCGGYHGLPAMHLDYVGHANVTDRLNTVVGPEHWSLEPIAFDDHGNPVMNSHGELWCRLTIMGASKLCVGDGSTDAKQLIGDALRNGAMRFGVALDLWTKDELESHLDAPELKNDKPSVVAPPAKSTELILPDKLNRIREHMRELGITGDEATTYCQQVIGKDKPTTNAEADKLINSLTGVEPPF